MGMRRGTKWVRGDISQHIPNGGHEGLLRLVPKPAPSHTPLCYFCKKPLPPEREKYCKDTHARSANDLKWKRAGEVLFHHIASLPDSPTLPLKVIRHTLAHFGKTPAGRKRRSALMEAFGFVYRERQQAWELVK